MDQSYKVSVTFRDLNIPEWCTRCPTEEHAEAEAWRIVKSIAGLKSICIQKPDGSKRVYNHAGLYLFTIPPMRGK
jgi:hypothetical protein